MRYATAWSCGRKVPGFPASKRRKAWLLGRQGLRLILPENGLFLHNFAHFWWIFSSLMLYGCRLIIFLCFCVQGGVKKFDYPKYVWSPTGGWWCNPRNWKRNTAICFAVVLGLQIPVALLSWSREVKLY